MFSSNSSQVAAATATQAEAIDFDGSNDYLQRADLTGNTDGQTFTFSFWVWAYGGFVYTADQTYFRVNISASTVKVAAQNTAGTYILDATTVTTIPLQTWTNIIISVDLANAANRSIYINDVAASVTWTTYTNATIDFTRTTQQVAANTTPSYQGRLSNVYFDKTYRNMSVTANRRLFVTADLKPAAGQAALNPILYLPMSDPTAPGTNSGTGGNFTLTGVVARSGRGPNQYNAPYSTLNGSTQYLNRTTVPTGMADGKQFTLQCVFNATSVSSGWLVSFGGSGPVYSIAIRWSGAGQIGISASNSAGTTILDATVSGFVTGRNYVLTMSVDLANSASRFVYVNGQAASVSWITYTNDTIDFSIATTPRYSFGANYPATAFFNGKLGAIWFNTSYVDLSVAGNLAKFVSGTGINADPVDPGATGELPTGSSPLIYLPMYGNNAGKNYGTGGDFTVNSGPYTGTRGPNEFWGNKIDFGNSGNTNKFLSRVSNFGGLSNGKTFSLSFWASPLQDPGMILVFYKAVSSLMLRVYNSGTGNLTIEAVNSAGTTILSAVSSASSTGFFQICIDLSSTAKRFIYRNGVLDSTTWTTYTNDTIPFSSMYESRIGQDRNGTYYNGTMAEMYFTTTYIDFSQEANRLKFRDAFGNPTDLPSAITDGTVPNPAVYMRFPPTSFGTNSGTGGNFTVNGTPTDGGQL